jgi:hypothetical protein
MAGKGFKLLWTGNKYIDITMNDGKFVIVTVSFWKNCTKNSRL